MYTVVFRPRAERQLQKLPHDVQSRICGSIIKLAETPRPFGCMKMRGQENRYRIRIGTYRVIYEVHDGIITIFIAEIDHRKDIYR